MTVEFKDRDGHSWFVKPEHIESVEPNAARGCAVVTIRTDPDEDPVRVPVSDPTEIENICAALREQ